MKIILVRLFKATFYWYQGNVKKKKNSLKMLNNYVE